MDLDYTKGVGENLGRILLSSILSAVNSNPSVVLRCLKVLSFIKFFLTCGPILGLELWVSRAVAKSINCRMLVLFFQRFGVVCSGFEIRGVGREWFVPDRSGST